MIVLGPALLALIALAATTVWLVTTSAGLRAAALLASAFIPGLTLSGVEGTLGEGVRIASSNWHARAGRSRPTPWCWNCASGR